MTELQFLVDLLLNHKLNTSTKKLVAERISFVEEHLRSGNELRPKLAPRLVNGAVQAASTQALLDRDASVPNSTPIALAPLPALAPTTQRIVGGEVNTGKGTKGPRKF